jgi:hypothetical protein
LEKINLPGSKYPIRASFKRAIGSIFTQRTDLFMFSIKLQFVDLDVRAILEAEEV